MNTQDKKFSENEEIVIPPTTEETSTSASASADTPSPITLSHIKHGIKEAPAKVTTALKEGKGNTAINKIQTSLAALIGAVPTACRLLILNQLLLTPADKGKYTRNCMSIGGLCCIAFLIVGLVKQDSLKLMRAFLCIVAVVCTNIFVSKPGVALSTQIKTKTKASVALFSKTSVFDGDVCTCFFYIVWSFSCCSC